MWAKITRRARELAAWHDRLKSSGQALAAFLVAGLCNVFEFYEGWISLGAGVYAWWMGHKRHAAIQAIHRIRAKRAEGHGFTWYDRSLKRSPSWLRLIDGRASSSGLIWDAFTVGVSRETGEPVSVWLKLYGTNEGIGHYYYRVVEKWGDGIYGMGHFGLMPDVQGWDHDYRKLDNALRLVGSPTELGSLCRPVDLEVSEEGEVEIYDPESGRNIFMNPNEKARREDFLIFGPYPARRQGENGPEEAIKIRQTDEQNLHNRLRVEVKDIYDSDLDHVMCRVADSEGNGWSYQHKLEAYGLLITVPEGVKRVNVKVWRGGYGTLTASVELGETVPLVEGRLAPVR